MGRALTCSTSHSWGQTVGQTIGQRATDLGRVWYRLANTTSRVSHDG